LTCFLSTLGNMAFQDAASLLDCLTGEPDGSATQLERLCKYEGELCQRSEGVVGRSIAGSARFFGMQPIANLKPVSDWRW
jgi:2-polyprenyl-6-methoxyphenol hydroxylase-like FAD-dependent oxidoreductase